jgi:hypothetical protein
MMIASPVECLAQVPELHVPQMARGVGSEDVKDPEVRLTREEYALDLSTGSCLAVMPF